MANQEQLDILRQGVKVWNQWRKDHADVLPDLSNAKFQGVNFSRANFSRANLTHTYFHQANLSGANCHSASLYGANFTLANLRRAELSCSSLSRTMLAGTDLTEANLRLAVLHDSELLLTKHNNTDLSGANLEQANFNNTRLHQVSFEKAKVGRTMFGNIDLRQAKGLETVTHSGPSSIGIDTIINSHGNIPEVFLKGAGLDDTFIAYARSLIGKPIEYFSCFISYSNQDESFAKRLYADLQDHDVRCWFASEDLKIGDKFRQRVDESIRIYDKLLLVLSEASLASTWVSYEVEKALDKEPEGKPNVLFPIRLDKTILTCETEWAKDIRRSRHIGDFEHWKDHDAYQIAFERLLRDLKAQA